MGNFLLERKLERWIEALDARVEEDGTGWYTETLLLFYMIFEMVVLYFACACMCKDPKWSAAENRKYSQL